MTIDQKALEKARDAYRRETLPVYPIVPANHDKALETAITAYITGLPASDHAGLASRVFYPVNNPSAWPDGFNQNISDLLREAATVIQTMQRENARLEGEAEAWAAQLHHAEYDRDFNEKARANWKSRAEAAEQQVRDMRAGQREAFVLWVRAWAKKRFGVWITHNTAKGAFAEYQESAHLLLKEGGE